MNWQVVFGGIAFMAFVADLIFLIPALVVEDDRNRIRGRALTCIVVAVVGVLSLGMAVP